MAFEILDAFVKVSLDDQVTSKLGGVTSAIGNGLAAAAKVGAAAVAATGAAVASLASKSVTAFADFEQLAGGVSTLFGDAQSTVFANAEQAFRTAGLSANEYMETVTSFSASLIQSLGGDTAAAAAMADMAITDMSDNANKMGTSMESIQNAYNGFAKQNYTMLDNLKLGYGGTKEEMERLLKDAEKMDSSFRARRSDLDTLAMDYDDIVQAIHVVQTNMGITGTTALEAESTIQGSLAMTKSAWENVLTAMSGGTEEFTMNFSKSLDNLINSASTFFENVKPRVLAAIEGVGMAITKVAPKLAEMIPPIIESLLPALVTSITALIQGASGVIPTIIQVIAESAPLLLSAGLTILSALGNGILDNLETIVTVGLELIAQLSVGLVKAIPQLLMKIPEILKALYNGFKNAAPELIQAGYDIIQAIGDGINKLTGNALTWGHDLIENFIQGIKDKIASLQNMVSNVAQTVKNFLGFSEPDEGPLSNFHTYAPDMMKLFAQGIKDNESIITDQIGSSFDFGSQIKSGMRSIGNGSSGSDGTINIVVQSVLDGKVIGETAYKWQKGYSRAMGV